MAGPPSGGPKAGRVIDGVQPVVVAMTAHADLDQAVNAAGNPRQLVKGGVEEQPDQVLHRPIRLVGRCFLPQPSDDGVLGIDLHGLCHHDACHVCRPSVSRGGEHARRVGHAPADRDLPHVVAQNLLNELGERLKLRLDLLEVLLPVLVLIVQALVGCGLQLRASHLLERLQKPPGRLLLRLGGAARRQARNALHQELAFMAGPPEACLIARKRWM
eukprot:9581964-Lingulodinium_polyedra.AAC.1